MQRVNSDHSKRVSAGTVAAGNTLELRQEGTAAGARSEALGKKTATIPVMKQQPGKSF